ATHTTGSGSFVSCPSRWFSDGPAIRPAFWQLFVRSGGTRRDRGGGPASVVRRASRGMEARYSVRAFLLLRATPMTPVLLAVLLTVVQDTSAIDRGVRIGIIYRPGVRPGLVMLPRTGMGLDSVRAIVARD